ncbi:MAG TPA: hypothetical protein VE592_07960 [Geminicoccaceae bacterium]|nr:hypothetical protein [Geminicoccaceae bacterium]
MFTMTVGYTVLDGTAKTVEIVLATDDTASAIREANAVVKAGLLVNRELGVPAVVAGDLVFQVANPVGTEGGIELIPPHRIAGVRLTPVPSPM